MRGRNFILPVLILAVWLGMADATRAAGPPRGRPIEFAAPSLSEKTNLTQTARKTDGLKELQDGLIQPLHKSIQPGSLDGTPVLMELPGARNAPVKKDRAKEIQELRKSWGVIEKDDLKDETERKLLGEMAPDEERTGEDLQLSATDEFFFNLLQSDPSFAKSLNGPRQKSDREKEKDREAEQDKKASAIPEIFKRSEEELATFLNAGRSEERDNSSLGQRKNPLRDFFNLGAPERSSATDEAARKERLREYKEIYGMSGGGMNPKEMFESLQNRPAGVTSLPATAFRTPGAPLSGLAQPGFATGPVTPVPSTFGSSPLGMFPSLPGPSAPSGAPSLIQKMEPSRRVLPQEPASFEAPRRPF